MSFNFSHYFQPLYWASLSDHAVIIIISDIGSTLHCKFLTMPAPVANYFVEQGRGVFRRGALCQSPLFGLPVMFEYLTIVRKIEPCLTSLNLGRKSGQKNGLNLTMTWVKTFFFFWSSPKSGQKNGLNLSKNLCFLSSSFWSSCFSFGFYLSFQISGYSPGPSFRKSCVRH